MLQSLIMKRVFLALLFFLIIVVGSGRISALDSNFLPFAHPPFGAWNKNLNNPALVDSNAVCFFPEVILSDVRDPLRVPMLYPHPITKVNYYWLYYDTCWIGGARLAYSKDLIKWTPYENNPVLPAVIGDSTLFIGNMFFDNGKYYLFYDVAGGVKYAVSPTPFGPWTKSTNKILVPGALGTWDEGRVTETFIFRDGDTYYMYYMGDLVPPFGRREQVGLATTSVATFPAGPWKKMGLKLTINPSSWDSQVVADPSIIHVGNYWYMLYTGSSYDQVWRLGVAYATSPSGPWKRLYNYPILDKGSAGAWDNDRILRGSIHFFNNKFYMPYAGSDSQNFRGGFATAGIKLISPTPTPVSTIIPTVTINPTIIPTGAPTPTLVPTNVPTATLTLIPTPTPTKKATLTPTNTPVPTATPTPYGTYVCPNYWVNCTDVVKDCPSGGTVDNNGRCGPGFKCCRVN